jgi:arsenate reductase-like glutaredoxin family protein
MTVRIDWSYQRPGCYQCQRAQAFLAQADVTVVREQDAKQDPVPRERALQLVAQVSHLHSARGKSIVQFDLRRETPDEATLVKLVLRPEGDLRAPALRVGTMLIVGFHPEMYEKIFVSSA